MANYLLTEGKIALSEFLEDVSKRARGYSDEYAASYKQLISESRQDFSPTGQTAIKNCSERCAKGTQSLQCHIATCVSMLIEVEELKKTTMDGPVLEREHKFFLSD